MMAPGLDSFYTSTSSTATASPPSVSPDNDFDDASRNPKRTPKACDRCRHKKTKCTGDSPCQRCRLDNTVCSFTNRRPKEGPSFNPQVAQKDAAMSMLYKCIEVMNRQLLSARLGPYTDVPLAEFAESEEFIIGIILDRFGISPVLDEFDNQPVYLPGQRGFNPDNCAVEFPQHSNHGDGYEEEHYSQGARYTFIPQSTGAPHSLYSSRSDISHDVQMTGQGEAAGYEIPSQAIPVKYSTTIHSPNVDIDWFPHRDFSLGPQRHHTYTYGQQPVAREHPAIWTHENKVVGEPHLLQEIYPATLNGTDHSGYLAADSSSVSHSRQSVAPSAYELQQAQIERIRREQLGQRNPHTQTNITRSPPLGPGYTGLQGASIPLPPHIAQVAEMEPVTTQWDFPSAVTTAGANTYPSALCSARGSPDIRVGGRRSPHVRGGSQTPESSMYTTTGSYMELSDPMVRSMRW